MCELLWSNSTLQYIALLRNFLLDPRISFQWSWALNLQTWVYRNGKRGVWIGKEINRQGLWSLIHCSIRGRKRKQVLMFEKGWAVFGEWQWKVPWAILVGKNPDNNLLLQQNLKRAENKQCVNAVGTRHSCHLRRVIGKGWVRACSGFGGAAL